MEEKFLKEDLLQYLWNIGDIDLANLKTTSGDSIQILKRGILNKDAGPDFLNGKVKIGNTVWVGNIEIHKYSKDWNIHKHQHDPAYENVILHVVFKEDKVIKRSNLETIPCLTLYDRIRPDSIKKYHKLLYNPYDIPCQFYFPKINQFKKNIWLDKLLIERLENKTNYIRSILNENINDWENTLFIAIAKYLSPNINRALMEELAQRTPLKILLKHKNDITQIEAILFGQSGLLYEISDHDDYSQRLLKEYTFLKQKYNLVPLKGVNWKFSRMRPLAFPTIRIAQLAQYVKNSNANFSKLIQKVNLNEVNKFFQFQLTEYWLSHFKFGYPSKEKIKTIGSSSIDIITINVIVPFLFLYGKSKDDTSIKEYSIQLLSQIKPEKNTIINMWKNLGENPKNAADTQSLINLKKEYCDQKKCLSCDLGNIFMHS